MDPKFHSVARVAEGYSFLEGPRWRHDRLYVSDFYTRRVVAFDERGGCAEICQVPDQPSGLGFAPDGSLMIVAMTARKVLRLVGGRFAEVADLSDLASFHCNDMLVDEIGRAYVGNFGWDLGSDPALQATVLVTISPEGDVSVAARDLVFPNGMARTSDRKTLLVAETFASRISAFDIGSGGALSNRRVWAQLGPAAYTDVPGAVASGEPLPDGIVLDAAGTLWIGDAGGRGALRVGEGGDVLDRVDTGNLSVYAVALGGTDLRTLYMCAAPPLLSHDPVSERRAALLSCRVDTPGLDLA